jgi:hypothetical protein
MMLEMRLRYKPNREPLPVLGIGGGYRWLFGGCALACCSAMILLVQLNWPLLGLAMVCVAGALYEESWSYNPQTGFFERRLGIVFWYQRRLISTDDIQAIVLATSPLARTTICSLQLKLVNGDYLVLERQKTVNNQHLSRAATDFTRQSGLPLEIV